MGLRQMQQELQQNRQQESSLIAELTEALEQSKADNNQLQQQLQATQQELSSLKAELTTAYRKIESLSSSDLQLKQAQQLKQSASADLENSKQLLTKQERLLQQNEQSSKDLQSREQRLKEQQKQLKEQEKNLAATIGAYKKQADNAAKASIKEQQATIDTEKAELKAQKEAAEKENEEYKEKIKADITAKYINKYNNKIEKLSKSLAALCIIISILLIINIWNNVEVIKEIIEDVINIKTYILGGTEKGVWNTITSIITGIGSSIWLIAAIVGTWYYQKDDYGYMSVTWAILIAIRICLILLCLACLKSALAVEIITGSFGVILLLAAILGWL